jgi:hypothetical protein
VEFGTAILAMKGGSHPAMIGIKSIFKLIESLMEDVAQIQKLMEVLESPNKHN